MYSKIRNPVTNRLVKSGSTLGKRIILKYIENIKEGGASLVSVKKKINNSDVLRDIVTKKSKNINILLGANVNNVNAQKGSWDLCISNGMDIIDEKYQQKNWPCYQEINENGKNIPGQVILDWNKPKEMEVLSILKGRVDLMVFDWSSSGLESWNGELYKLIPLLQVNGKLFIEEYIKAMGLIGNFLMPNHVETYLNGYGYREYNSRESRTNRGEKDKILFGEKNSDKNIENLYREGGIFNLDINKNLLIEPCCKTTEPLPDSRNVISLFRDVYIQTIPKTFNYYLNFQNLTEKNNNIISTLRLNLNINGKQTEDFFPKLESQFNYKERFIKRGIITSKSEFKYFYKRTRKSENKGEGLVETFPTEDFNWKYPVTDPTTGKEINSFHVIQRLY